MEKQPLRLHGKSMRLLRVNHGLNGVQMGKEIGVSKAYVSMCETNIRILSAEKTKKFLEVIGITEDEARAFVEVVGY
ncbi:helix-turn-helix domain-containing protein [Mesobacillus maritimus]|uniref:Helix-turn-helix transcriptional regulator n=1 Tax=Mesobacillus maritimus TaxID=1643336 RepID=A0ABS7K980_9BACI|nr:helix-turn-helix transcriptional regulator [Mesobacillus maritimus]MBY0098670.1 helix-turn-helix transcriptional regulator [Mesobacillus maritimus]